MNLETELKKLKKHFGKPGSGFEKQMALIAEHFPSKEDKKRAANYVKALAADLVTKTDHVINEATVKMQLSEVSEIISLSYIAKRYFNKTRQWMYARINGNLVNGKPAKFTNEEIGVLNQALAEVGKKIGSTRVSLG